MLVERGLVDKKARQGYSVRRLDLREINELYPASLGRGDVRFWMGGLRPLGDEDTNPEIAQALARLAVACRRRFGPRNGERS